MNIEQENTTTELKMQLTGRLDAQSAGALDTELEEAVRLGEHHIRLDMAGVDYMSSAGIRTLVKYYKTLQKLGGSFSVYEPTETIRTALRLTGLNRLIAGIAKAETCGEEKIEERSTRRHENGVTSETYPVADGATLRCRTFGRPDGLLAGFVEADCVALRLPVGVAAIGLGAFGREFSDCRTRFGEFLAVGGTAAYLPADGSKTPDYMISEGDLVPEIRALYGLTLEGDFSQCVRFEADDDPGAATLAELVGVAFDAAKTPMLGIVILAETAGLVGASLKRSPADGAPPGALFDHPGIRDWLTFTPERAYDRDLALVVGIAGDGAQDASIPFLRPLSDTAPLRGHFHAVVFHYHALPKGPIPLDETIQSLFEGQAPIGVLHLVHDRREIYGAGDSLFIRGAMWLGPVDRGMGDA